MAKVTARITVRGVDLGQMMAQAKAQLAELSDAKWSVSEVDLYSIDEMATKDGMAPLWSASMTLEANVTDG